jgi:WhiB family redox-sensing transcriptional regulator
VMAVLWISHALIRTGEIVMTTKNAPARPGRRRPTFTGWLPVRDTDWRDQALCRGRETEVFFPEGDQPTIIAKSICRRCPVRRDCLAHALERSERYGIWGGLTERERQLLRARIARVLRAAAAASTIGDDGPVAA